MKRIAVLTSGGDAPGMNAAIRAVVRSAAHHGWEILGVRHGFAGLIDDTFVRLGSRDVGGILQRGGTLLGSARCTEFHENSGQTRALQVLANRGVDALVVIGGNGSQAGAHALSGRGFPVVGVASTIDNDLCGTEVAIGVDTALNIAVEAIDRLKVTASSHQRAFLVEVMGRDCGYLALNAGIAGGAEAIVVPEFETDPETIAFAFRSAYDMGKAHALAVVAEGARYNAEFLSHYFAEHRQRLGFDLRITVLGHVQRGGTPTVFDRLLATRLGTAATDYIARNCHGVLLGLVGGRIAPTPFEDVVSQKKTLDQELLALARVLSN